jgi:hypothetical protein
VDVGWISRRTDDADTPHVPAQRLRVVFSMEGLDPQLVQAVRQGTYVVDPHAVADAIVRRERRQLADVLEALEVDGAPAGVPEDDSGTFPDAA